MGSKCHTNCHQATSRCMSQVIRPLTGYQAQGPTYSRLGPGLFSDAQGLPLGLVFKASGKARPTSRGHKSPSGKPKQAEPHGGRAGRGLEAWLVVRGGEFRVHPQGAGHGPLAHMLPRGPFSLSLDSALPRPWPGKDRQN